MTPAVSRPLWPKARPLPVITWAIRGARLENTARFCIGVSAILLALSALSKLISAWGSARILTESDPIFGVTNAQLFILAGLLEAWVVSVLVRSHNLRLKLILVAVLGANFLIYRAGLWWLGFHACPCMGNAASWMGVDQHTLDVVTKGALAWFLVTSLSLLPLLSWQEKSLSAE